MVVEDAAVCECRRWGGPLFDLCTGSLHLSALKMMQIAAVCVINFIEELQKERGGGRAGEFNPCIQHGLYYKHKKLVIS